jgi:uncharacterized coiled-coil protein SlyX
MSALTQADNDELDAQLLAQNNVIDGLSLVISRQQAVMRQALNDICGAKLCEVNSMSSRAEARRLLDKATNTLREALEGKQ